MLRLESISSLAAATKALPPLSTTLAPGAAHSFVLAQQEDNGLLGLHSVGFEGIYSQIYLRSRDTLAGQMYLWPLADLKGLLDQLESSYAIQISCVNGSNLLETYTEVIDDQPSILDTNYLSTFTANFDEFKLPALETVTVSFETNAPSTLEILGRANTYGEYANRSGGDRAVLLTLKQDSIECYAIPQAAPNFYFEQQLKIFSTTEIEEQELVILGCHLAQIVSFFNDKEVERIGWALSNNYLELSTNNKKLKIPLQKIDKFAYLKPISASFKMELGSLKAKYTVPVLRTIVAAKAQQAARSNNRFLKLSSQPSGLRLGKVSDILNKEWSLLEVYSRKEIDDPLEVIINGPAFLKSLVVLENFLKKAELSCNLQLSVWSKTIGTRQKWVMHVQLDHLYASTMPSVLSSISITAS
jgi:hypothetical protein